MENFNLDNVNVRKLHAGDKVEGEVVLVTDNTIYLDIQCFTEGKMHLDHYTKDKSIESFKGIVKVGDKIKCEVAKVSEESILLSRLNQIGEENLNKLHDIKENNETIKVKVTGDANGNGFTGAYLGIQVFIPKSQATESVKVGETVEVKVIDVDNERKKCVCSRRAIEQEIYQDNKSKEYDAINVGDVLKGTITKIEKYGAIVKFEYNQGLLKANQVSHMFVDINKELSVGQEIEVKVTAKENGRLELSRKALLETPFNIYVKDHTVGQTVKGKVCNKLAFGLLIELAPNVKGLLHSSEYSHNPNDNFNNHVVIGDEVEVAILNINAKDEKISLSRKALIDNPWSRVDAKEGDLVDIKVVEVKENGLLVEALGVDGFVPQSEALTQLKGELSQYYAKGDEAQAIIIEIKPREWRLKLSIRKHLVNLERQNYEKYLDSNEEISSSLGDMLKDILK
ncbi:MAG: 30S ribosomal protein S1 [Acholeplasmatales bacterium]|nr:30S ribosomal protein S1 [Acholeplasmatales bacterium]